ncbi:MAG: hypothetical protein AB7P31_13725 [Steroidobacteraceae bacterium]
MWRILRVTFLLLVLVAVASTAWLDRVTTRDWKTPLWVGLYPIAADDDAITQAYLAGLSRAPFLPIEQFFAAESRNYAVAQPPVHIELYPRAVTPPPELPAEAGPLRTALWSLALRWYAWRATSDAGGAPPSIRIFVLFHSPRGQPVLPHSRGLAKGLVGVVHAYADRDHEGANNVVIAHEFLHTLGASDKYDPASLQPRWPEGYAQPRRTPRFPQPLAEIMAGRRALSDREAEMPASLDEVVVGAATAREIAWVTP